MDRINQRILKRSYTILLSQTISVYTSLHKPELPDITLYVERLAALVQGQHLESIQIGNPFVLRTFEPKLEAFAGRLRWRPPGAKLPKRQGLAAFYFANGTLLFTEAGSKRRASLHLVEGSNGLSDFDRGGVDMLQATPQVLGDALRQRNRTLKRALTDPAIVDGIGNAYSDEILHRAKLSPLKLTGSLADEEVIKLHQATIDVVTEWIARLRGEVGSGFPEKVTAFRPGMAVHGKYGQPCPVCGAKVQRVVYAQNEMNYCPGCQTDGRILADRALSRLLKKDWPRTLEELERLSSTKRA